MERQRLSLAETEKINQSLQMKMEELDRVISQAGRAVSSFVNYPAYVATAGRAASPPAALICCQWMRKAASWS